MNRKLIKRMITLSLIISFFLGLFYNPSVFADTMLLPPPTNNRVAEVGNKNIEDNGWYARLEWNFNSSSFPEGADTSMILGLNEISTGTGQVIPDAITTSLGGSTRSDEITLGYPYGIKRGTIYESYLKASYRIERDGVYTITSQKSNPAKFLTDLAVSVSIIPGTNSIKITWDDVWDTTGRIDYDILIADTKTGSKDIKPIPRILATEIGKEDSNVTINSAEKKLEYIYIHTLPGREYSITVVPKPSENVKCAKAEEIKAIKIKTEILLQAQKIGYNNDGDTIWKLFWNPIVMENPNIKVNYKLSRYTNNLNPIVLREIYDKDNYQITIKKGDTNTYSFKIDADVYEPGAVLPIEFISETRVELKEQIPQTPQAPEIVDIFENSDPPLKYEDFLEPFSASVFWKAPITGEGIIDGIITYDIYLLKDVKDINSLPSNYKIASDISMTDAHKIKDKDSGSIIGYKYDLNGLTSNSTYYFVIYAKKNYLVPNNTDGLMVTRPYKSTPSVKVIITEPDAGGNRPVAPSAPPFGVEEDPETGLKSITYTGATLVLDKIWYAFYEKYDNEEDDNEDDNEEDDNLRGYWKQCSKKDFDENEGLDSEDVNKKKSQKVVYEAGWSVKPHVVSYSQALDVIRNSKKERVGEYIAYSDLFDDVIKNREIPQREVRVPDIVGDDDQDQDQTFPINISGLKENTTYLVWLTIENQNGLSSDPSDPIIITTQVEIPPKPVKPIVPTDLKGIPSDSFVDLFWTEITGMDYEIKCGTSDDISQASITKLVTYEDKRDRSFFRVDSLAPDTVYYFWIRAKNAETGEASEYSNPELIKTEAHKPPAPPTGFGIKTGPDGVTESSITYQWTELGEMNYILEISEDINFTQLKSINVNGDTYTAGGLISNRRYYARLFAYDPKTQLRSMPTRTIMVITNKSKSEYDSSFDLEEAVTGDGLDIPAKLEDGVWVISSLGADAHVLGERIRSRYDSIVKIDLSVPPEKTTTIRLELSSVVLDALASMRKELYLILPWGEYTILPGTFQTDEYFRMKTRSNELEFRLETQSPASQYVPLQTMAIKTPVTDFKLSYINGSPISILNRPIRVELPVAGITAYAQGQIKTFAYNSSQGWYKLPTFTDYSLGRVISQLDKPGAIVAATEGLKPQTTVPVYIRESMERIQTIYDLKSIKNERFMHNSLMTQKDILKLLFDVLEAEYSEYDMAQKAVGAGLINNVAEVTGSYVRRDKAVNLLIEFYKFKTRENALPTKPGIWSHYTDLNKAENRYLSSYKFALELGIIQGNATSMAYPERMITIGDFLVMLERTLRVSGDL